MGLFSLFFLILLIILNTMLGCFFAILLGYGPPTFPYALKQLGILQIFGFVLSLSDGVHDRIQSLFKKREPKAKAEIVEEKPKIDVDAMLKSIVEADVGDLLEDDADQIEMVVPLQELFDDDLASALMEKGTEAWLMGEKHVETSILKLNIVMMKSGKFSAELDSRLRLAAETGDPEFVKRCAGELVDDCRNYLDVQASMTEQIQKRIDEFGELSYLAEDIDYANMEQSAQIETTISNVEHINPDHPREGIKALIKELSKLRAARHRLRDQQEKAFLTVTRYESRMETIAHQLFIDESNGLRNRIGLEVTLWDWWNQKRHQNRQICLALMDFVKFGELNDEHGITIGEKIIKYFGRLLEKEFGSQDMTGIYSGNCFMIVTVNSGLRKTVSEVEKIRQGLERTVFTYQRESRQFSLESTCGITEARQNQSDLDAMKAVENTLAAAKKGGKNRSFLLDQEKLNPEPELVESPNLGSEYLTIDLDTID